MATNNPPGTVLDSCFLEVRAKLIEIAASLDRIDRADDRSDLSDDPRLDQIRQAVEILNARRGCRAEKIQLVFSDDYDPDWNQRQA